MVGTHFSGSSLCTCWMCTARPPAVFRRRGHKLHLKCFAFWCCINTVLPTHRSTQPPNPNRQRRTLFILELALTVPAPRADDLTPMLCQNLRNQHRRVKRTCLFFFFAILLCFEAGAVGGKGDGVGRRVRACDNFALSCPELGPDATWKR